MQDGKTALHLAAGSDYEGKEKLTLLLKNGASVNAEDKVSFDFE